MEPFDPYAQSEDIIALGILCAALKDLVAVTATEAARANVLGSLGIISARVAAREQKRVEAELKEAADGGP